MTSNTGARFGERFIAFPPASQSPKSGSVKGVRPRIPLYLTILRILPISSNGRKLGGRNAEKGGSHWNHKSFIDRVMCANAAGSPPQTDTSGTPDHIQNSQRIWVVFRKVAASPGDSYQPSPSDLWRSPAPSGQAHPRRAVPPAAAVGLDDLLDLAKGVGMDALADRAGARLAEVRSAAQEAALAGSAKVAFLVRTPPGIFLKWGGTRARCAEILWQALFVEGGMPSASFAGHAVTHAGNMPTQQRRGHATLATNMRCAPRAGGLVRGMLMATRRCAAMPPGRWWAGVGDKMSQLQGAGEQDDAAGLEPAALAALAALAGGIAQRRIDAAVDVRQGAPLDRRRRPERRRIAPRGARRRHAPAAADGQIRSRLFQTHVSIRSASICSRA